MNYLTSDISSLIWLLFSIYAVSILLIIPTNQKKKSQNITIEATNEQALQLASNLLLRITLIFPMLFLLKNIA